MARPLWTGAISFGLVNIPVELYPAEEHKEFKFSMLDKRDFSPVGYKRYSKKSNKEVEWANIVKGYEYDKDQYVVLSDEDFRRANVKASQTIEIHAFVPAIEIPIQYFDTPYFLAPTARGKKVYALLRETLHSTGRVAVAQVVIRTAQHLAAVVPVDRALMLNTMRYSDQLRPPERLDLPAAGLKGAGVTAKEIELAKRLVERHGRALEACRVQGHLSPGLDAAHPRENKEGRNQADHRAGQGPGRQAALGASHRPGSVAPAKSEIRWSRTKESGSTSCDDGETGSEGSGSFAAASARDGDQGEAQERVSRGRRPDNGTRTIPAKSGTSSVTPEPRGGELRQRAGGISHSSSRSMRRGISITTSASSWTACC